MKKENYLVVFLKGFIIGLGIIFPISASVLALVMGLYKRILKIINNLKTELKKEWKFILALGLGIVVSALVSCLVIGITYDKYPVATLLFFIGLIAGGVPVVWKKVDNFRNFKDSLWLIVGFILILMLSVVGASSEALISTSSKGLVTIFLVGMTAAGTMIIPGVSGSAILVTLGYYEPMLKVVSETVKFHALDTNILIIAFFGVGMLIGILIVSKLMDFFLKEYENKTYFAIVGFVVGSIINLFILVLNYSVSIIEIIVGMMLAIIGFILSCKYLKED